MSFAAITPARLSFREDGTPSAPEFGNVHHSDAGALTQAEQVFLHGSRLPRRWAGEPRFVILETGFGLGNNFLATWEAWRRDAQRCERLVFVAIEKHPLTRADAARLHQHSPLPDLARQLVEAWPLPTPDIHLLDFEGGRVQLMLVLADVHEALPALQLQADAFYLDGLLPPLNPAMWSAELFQRLGKLARPGATATTGSDAHAVRDGLGQAGFKVERLPDAGSERNKTAAHYAPRFVPPQPRAWAQRPADAQAEHRHALVIGAGLAGCAAAHGLALQGWRCTVIDRQPGPAQVTSGNAGGLFHTVFNAPDSLHARWFRAAADLTQRLAAPWVATGRVAGQINGLLRLEPRLSAAEAAAQQAGVGLPDEVLQWRDADQASAALQLALPCGGWLFGQGGWLAPADYAQALLEAAGALAPLRWLGGQSVQGLRHGADGWSALDADGQVIAQAPVVVLANAMDAARLLPPGLPELPLSATRGQTTLLPANHPGLRPPAQAVSGQGYALQLPDGRVLIGATSQNDDSDPTLRPADHLHNLARAAMLGVVPAAPDEAPNQAPNRTPEEIPMEAPPSGLDETGLARLEGRVGWRATTPDRLPLVGPVVDLAALQALRTDRRHRVDAPRHLPRVDGLYVLAGLGSRGITSAALAGRLLASWITGAPCPVEQRLRDAVDPGRYCLRG
jgi:tRNA 5-methylaminomethyl-2-thiouridine biosynthesis bifunctional protein